MLFNSTAFVFGFLPVTFALFVLLLARGWQRGALHLVVLASLFFYAWWDWKLFPLLAGSILFNFLLAGPIDRAGGDRRWWLAAFGVAANLLLLGIFKYSFFVETNLHDAGLPIPVYRVVLPIGISFFTFQQIAYLVDTYKSGRHESGLAEYALFITFFPHLIAGPLTHHSYMISQFTAFVRRAYDWRFFAVGFSIFVLALGKKVLIADSLGHYADAAFGAAAGLRPLSAWDAWVGALSYALHLYFDFSAYSEMAIGLGVMFGIRLPINFASPYKAASIIDFWRCWHITLSAFLRNYLYIPLGGNRHGPVRRYANLMLTMLLGGLWHGAGWTFLFWGGLHGAYLMVNHAWRHATAGTALERAAATVPGRVLCVAVTFLAVLLAWVFFRADSFAAAVDVLEGMAGLTTAATVMPDAFALPWLLLGLAVAWLAPGLLEVFGYDPDPAKPLLGRSVVIGPVLALPKWRMSLPWAAVAGVVFAFAIVRLPHPTIFLYFNF